MKAKVKNKVKTEIKAKAKVFSISTLTSTCILILTLILFVLPEDAMAQREDMMRMRKYSLWGDIMLQYEDVNSESNGSSSRTNRFTQNYKLNFRSYVVSPRLMYYTITTGFDVETGTMGAKGATKSYGIDTVFFPTKPLSFSLRASKSDGPDYETTNYGLSMSYARKARRIRPVRPAVPPEENVNRNLNINANLNKNANLNANLNKNANLNANTNEEGNTNENVAKPKPKLEKKPPSSKGFFYDILPQTYMLDVDRNDIKYKDGSESKWDNAALRFAGLLRKTSYYLNFDYDAWSRDGSEHKGFGSELRTDTTLKWSFFQKFENNIYYQKNDITSYNINSWLTGIKGKQRYEIYANYFSTSNGESAKRYSILADVQNAVPYTYKKVDIFYDAGIGFERLENKNDFFAKGKLYTNKRLSLNTNLNSSLGLRGGTEYSEADFLTGISYTFRPRKGYVVSIELDPQGNTLKTRAFEPQVYGWDYSIRTGYTFGILKTTGERGFGWGGATWTNKTLISHRANLNINVYLRLLTISSDAYFYYTDAGKRLEWNNSIYATVMRKIGVTIGTGLTMDMPEDGTKATNYNIYNLITYRLWRTALLRLDSRYTKVMPANTTTLEVTPSLSWAWRRVFVDLEVRLKTDKTGNGAETTERRIMLRATRPFNIL